MEEIKRLDKTHQQDFIDFNNIIRSNLTNQAWFMPFSEENAKNTFSPQSTLVVYGLFVDGVLAAISLFDTYKEEFLELSRACNIPDDKKGAELGGSMVLPQYRGRNLMFKINQKLVEVAKDMGYDYFVATVHPDNKASHHSVTKLGMKHVTTITRAGGYLRNVYLLEF